MLNKKSTINLKLELNTNRHKRVLSDLNSSPTKLTRYLQCNADTPVRVLAKLIRNKYDIPLKYDVNKLNFRSLNYINLYFVLRLN